MRIKSNLVALWLLMVSCLSGCSNIMTYLVRKEKGSKDKTLASLVDLHRLAYLEPNEQL